MPTDSKRAKHDSPTISDTASDDDSLLGEKLNVDFAAFNCEVSDIDGIKTFLQQYMPEFAFDENFWNHLAQLIISQNYIGSVMKQEYEVEDDEDSDEIFGLSTILSLDLKKDEYPISDLRKTIVEKCHKSSTSSKQSNNVISKILETETVGLLISERLVNLPPQFTIPLYESLLKDIEESSKNGKPSKFSYYIVFSKILKSKQNSSNEIVWKKDEEEILSKRNVCTFDIQLANQTVMLSDDSDDEDESSLYSQWNRIYVIEASELPIAVAKMKTAFSE